MSQISSTKSARQFTGTVIKISGAKTISVRVDRKRLIPKYLKRRVVSRGYLVHDEKGLAKAGDRVLFAECRPLSKTKRWRLVRVV